MGYIAILDYLTKTFPKSKCENNKKKSNTTKPTLLLNYKLKFRGVKLEKTSLELDIHDNGFAKNMDLDLGTMIFGKYLYLFVSVCLSFSFFLFFFFQGDY